MENFQLLNIKQEQEVNFVLVLPQSSEPQTVEHQRITVKLKRQQFASKISVKFFEIFYRCKKCRKFLKMRSVTEIQHAERCNGSEKFICDFCPFSSRRKLKFVYHMKRHRIFKEKLSCQHCVKKFTHQGHLSCHLQAKSECLICSKTFFCVGALKKHLDEAHHGTFSCPHAACKQQKFASKNSLIEHLKSVHEGKKRSKKFQCDLCGLQIRDKFEVQKHMESHLKTKKFQCMRCGVWLRTQNTLNTHLRATPSTCLYCDAKFQCKLNLEKHYKEKHKTSESHWPCQKCSKVFCSIHTLKAHQKSKCYGKFYLPKQNNFECKKCPKTYSSRKSFRKHQKSVHGEVESRKCQICNVEFRSMARLQLHLKNHEADEKNLVYCKFCSFVTLEKQYLRGHVAKTHK
jgi:KRAB domain-containing zinc finger protein